MSFLHKHARLMLVALSCLALGAGASAIATAGAATGGAAHPGSAHRRHAGARRWLARAVHGNLTVATKQGFKTVTFDRGTLASVNGQQLTLTEGTRRSPHKTVTLTIPSTARVRDNRQKTALSSLPKGQRVLVVQEPKRTLVIAHTPR